MCPHRKAHEALPVNALLETGENAHSPGCFSNYKIGTKYYYDYKMDLQGKGSNKQKKQNEVLKQTNRIPPVR